MSSACRHGTACQDPARDCPLASRLRIAAKVTRSPGMHGCRSRPPRLSDARPKSSSRRCDRLIVWFQSAQGCIINSRGPQSCITSAPEREPERPFQPVLLHRGEGALSSPLIGPVPYNVQVTATVPVIAPLQADARQARAIVALEQTARPWPLTRSRELLKLRIAPLHSRFEGRRLIVMAPCKRLRVLYAPRTMRTW